MHRKLKIILLSPYLPAVNTSACARKVYDSIVLLNQRGHQVYLLSFCSEDDKQKIPLISQHCRQVHLEYTKDYSSYPANSNSLKKKICDIYNNENIDILQCEKAYMGRYVPSYIKLRSLLVEHEILSDLFCEKAKLEPRLMDKLIFRSRSVKKIFEEKQWYKKFSRIIVFSEHDKNIIFNRYDMSNIEIIPLGVTLKDYPLNTKEEKFYDCVFVGNFSHAPNVDAVVYFYNNILPLIKNKIPHISILVAGANPPESITRLAKLDKNINVAGYIDDISEAYLKGKIFIAPIRYGSGMRYKILEALTFNLPVVSTAIGARGILSNSALKIADNEERFSEEIIRILNNDDMGSDTFRQGRAVIEQNYSSEQLLDRYESIYYELLN